MSPSLRKSVAVLALASHSLVGAATFDLPIIFDNSYASVELDVGTPASTYRLFFDTGSASTWIANEQCASTTCVNGSGYARVGYNSSESSTSIQQGPYEEIQYSTPSDKVAGDASTDVFTLAACNSTLSWQQTFLSVAETSWRFVSADGFLGLAFSAIAATNTTTLFETLLQKRLVSLPRFGIYYGKEFSTTGDSPAGELTLGGSKEDEYVDGNLTWIPLREESTMEVWRTPWKTVSGSFGGSNTTNKLWVTDGRAVFDTGAGGSIKIPPELIESVYDSIGMNYTAIFSGAHRPLCTEFNASWSVSFDFGDWQTDDDRYTITLTGDELARPGFANSQDNCYPPFDSSEIWGFGLFGTALLHHRYSVWDFGAFDLADYKPRIGFGKLKGEYKA
ncbi:unnamed protein product [Diplocarpon coronariae]|nr:hypothetical protein JHW43_003464 [Diplocarpon mali]